MIAACLFCKPQRSIAVRFLEEPVWGSGERFIRYAPKTTIYSSGNFGGPTQAIWAAEIHRIKGIWYIYFAGNYDGNISNQRSYVLMNPNADPTKGTWALKGKISDRIDSYSIDGHPFFHNGQWYFTWSGSQDFTIYNRFVYVAKLANPWTIEGTGVQLVQYDRNWEGKSGDNIIEGPYTIVYGNKTYLTYSTFGYWNDNYRLGMMAIDSKADTLSVSSWVKNDYPVLQRNTSTAAFSTGHNSFFYSPDKSELWIAYHARMVANQQNVGLRATRVQKIDGLPFVVDPVMPGSKVYSPSGENKLVKTPNALSGDVEIISVATGKALYLSNCNNALSTALISSDRSYNACQRWNLEPTGDGYYLITSVQSGLVVEVPGSSTQNAAVLKTWMPNGAYTQQWKMNLWVTTPTG